MPNETNVRFQTNPKRVPRYALTRCQLIVITWALGQAFFSSQPCSSQMPSNSGTVRDAGAIALINSSLTAMGGSAAWIVMHGAIVSGTYADDRGTSGASFTWSDDWSGSERMRRETVTHQGGRLNLFLQDVPTEGTSNSSSATTDQKTPRRSRFDKLVALIIHLPGAALSAALQDPAYRLAVIAPPTVLPSNPSCVAIHRPQQSTGESVVGVAVCFSRSTSLPVKAYIVLPDLINPTRRLFETVQYDDFQQVGPVLIPKQVSVLNPAKRLKTFDITSASWNPAFASSTFSEGAQ